jgi:hypothetical protein
MVNVRSIKVSAYISLGFRTKKEALEFIRECGIKSNKNQNENDFLNIVSMKRLERIDMKKNDNVKKIINIINKGEDITINETMSAKTAKDIIEKVRVKDKRLKFTIKYDNGQQRSYLGNKDGFYKEEVITPYGSDTQEEIIGHNVESINVMKLDNIGYKKTKGAFFAYYNTTEINLTKYAIYKNKEESNYKDNCLIYTLIQTGKFSDNEINNIRMYCKCRETSLKTLNAISDEFGIDFHIYRYRPNCDKIEKKIIHNDNSNIIIEIATYLNHWFVYEDVNITRFFINHYGEIREYAESTNVDIMEYQNVNKYCNKTKTYTVRRDRKDLLNTLSLINLLYHNNLFKRINLEEVYEIPYYENFKDDDIVLPNEISETNYRIKNRDKKNDIKKEFLVYADFESTTMKNERVNAEKHRGFMVSYIMTDMEGNIIDKDTLSGKEYLVNDFLDKMKNNSIIYFHNLKYDKNFLFDYLNIRKYTEKQGQLYEIQAKYKDKMLYFRDSYKLISEPLSKFKDMFGLNVGKEVFPYNFYNEENIDSILEGRMLSITKAKRALPESKHVLFDECIKNVKYTDKRFNALEYAKYYCEQDVRVLFEGMKTFRNMVLEALNIDIIDKLTISSVAEQYLTNKGCYDGVYELSGITQAFINKSVYGGRVMVARNKPIEVNYALQDFDGVGLYASSMYTMKGFAIGKPSVILEPESFDIKTNELYYIEIELLDAYYERGKGEKIKNLVVTTNIDRYEFDYDFPLFADKDNNGIIEYVNFPKTRRHVVNNEILDDLIKFYKLEQNVHYRIIQGVLFKDGYNNKINGVMFYLFEERNKQKKNKNKIEKIYKLIMNSAYGKTLTKYNDTTIRIFNTSHEKKINTFIYNQYNNIKEILYTEKHTIIKLYNEYAKHWNCVHVGSAVLARSKVIMNKIFYICHILGLTPCYQDTDSIHIPEDQVKYLPKDFIGKNMCQFHCDFSQDDFKKIDKTIELNGEEPVYSVASIFLGKKSYIDILRHRQSDEIVYHIRFKGINNDTILETAKQRNQTPYGLYRSLLNGEKIEFNDKYSSKPRFKQSSICDIINREDNIKLISTKPTKQAK